MARAERTFVTNRRCGGDHGVRCLGGVMGDAHGGVPAVAGTRDPPAPLISRHLDRLLRGAPGRVALWVAYGLARHDLPLVLPNSLALLVTTFTIVVALRHRP